MPGAAIVIEIAAADAASPNASALVDACNHGPYANLTCSLSTETETEPPAALAVVNWHDSEHLWVSVQVGVRRQDGGDWSVRELRFVDSDAERERWRAVGLVIATLAGQVSAPASLEPNVVEPAVGRKAVEPPTHPPASPAVPPSLPELSSWWVDGEFRLGRGAAGAFSAWGGAARLNRRLGDGPLFVGGLLHFETEQASPTVGLQWFGAGAVAGVDVPLLSPRLRLEARLEPVFSLLSARSRSSELSGSSSGALWSLRQSVGLSWWWSRFVGVSIAGELSESHRRSVVRVLGQDQNPERILTLEQVGWGASAGLRWGF